MPKDIERKIRKAFTKALADISSQDEMESYIFDLLTPTERIMLAKRLAIAALLIKEVPYQVISDHLNVSTATVARVNLWLKTAGDGYRLAIGRIKGLEFDKL